MTSFELEFLFCSRDSPLLSLAYFCIHAHTHMKQYQRVLLVGSVCTVIIATVVYVVQDDRAVKARKAIRANEKQALTLLHQIKQDHQTISHELDHLDPQDTKLEYKLAYNNEMLLRLMERLDAIQPRAAILNDRDDTPTEFEETMIQHLKERKRKLIKSIERDFKRVDQFHK